MDVNLNKLNIDKVTWTLVKFGDVVKEPKENIKDIHAEGIEHVVGLEHIDSEDIHLRRSANLESGTTFTKKFRTGDVLFGRRRAYLKKAAQAPFSGICSGDITVFRAKDYILADLLPFVVCNDKFFDYAVKHSAGGLSPRVKFKDLANYEFLLPPKDQQKQLAELLWAMDDVIEREKELLYLLKTSFQIISFKSFSLLQDKGKRNEIALQELQNLITEPICNGIFRTKENFGDEVPLINVTDIYASFMVIPKTLQRIPVSKKELESFSANSGDVIFNRSSLVKEGVGHTCLVPEVEEKMVFECHLMRVRPNKKLIDPRFLCRYCLSPFGRNYLISRSQTTTMTTLNQNSLNKMRIPLPTLDEQKKIADSLEEIENIATKVKTEIFASQSLQKSLINLIF